MIGVDEVGRGSWAGPLLVVAARQKNNLPSGLKDSKILTKKRREALRFEIEIACDIGEGWVTAQEIDELGLTKAMELAVERALVGLKADVDEEIIMDGNYNYCSEAYINSRCAIKADALHPIVSAASIYAKVIRDDYMRRLAEEFPDYGFESHVGYGTSRHSNALRSYGVTMHHRKSYKPIKDYLDVN